MKHLGACVILLLVIGCTNDITAPEVEPVCSPVTLVVSYAGAADTLQIILCVEEEILP